MNFTVTLSNPSSVPVSVYYQTVNGTAIAGEDYVAIPPRTGLWLNPNETSKTVTVYLIGDRTRERDQVFYVRLSDFANCVAGDAEATGTIVDDDPVPTISIGDASTREGNKGQHTLSFVITLSNPTYETVTVQYATADGSAVAGEDYAATASSVTFNPGETRKDVTVNVLGDMLVEWDEYFLARLSNAANATMGDSEAVGTIVNDDDWLAATQLAVYRGSHWLLDTNGDGAMEDRVVGFGLPGDTAIAADWNGDGRDELWVVRPNTARGGLDWYLDLNADGYLGELVVEYGLLGDIPVAGDFNGDGRDELAVVRQNLTTGLLDWYLDLGRDGYLAERIVGFGLRGDVPVTGDFDGNGRDDLVAVRYNAGRGGLDWHIDLAGDGYMPERIDWFGLNGDLPVPGDWNGDGRDDLGIVRGGREWRLDMAGNSDYAEKTLRYGLPGDQFISGNWANYAQRFAAAVDAVFAGSGTAEGEGASTQAAPIAGAETLPVSFSEFDLRS